MVGSHPSCPCNIISQEPSHLGLIYCITWAPFLVWSLELLCRGSRDLGHHTFLSHAWWVALFITKYGKEKPKNSPWDKWAFLTFWIVFLPCLTSVKCIFCLFRTVPLLMCCFLIQEAKVTDGYSLEINGILPVSFNKSFSSSGNWDSKLAKSIIVGREVSISVGHWMWW